jgi:hypothetical protein
MDGFRDTSADGATMLCKECVCLIHLLINRRTPRSTYSNEARETFPTKSCGSCSAPEMMFRRERSLAAHHFSVPNHEARMEEYFRIIERVSLVGDKVGYRILSERIS